ncbi:MAG: arsenite methyltransferase [Cyanothece sp. SIO1E1]|nr:arsenite methyltransferase [Cyanothece sp. SIO1E1]
MKSQQSDQTIHQQVRTEYAKAADQAASGQKSSCGKAETLSTAFGATLYDQNDLAGLPTEAAQASLGCGNPTALANLQPGEIVLDLGSGGGIDVLLSAKRVGPTGKAYGLDMTDEMLALARENQRQAGVKNAEFLKGQIEDIPLPNDSIDTIISNCVVNLSPNKDAVLQEAYRVLRSGGRLAISDVVVRDAEPGESEIPAAARRDIELWVGCIAGALAAQEYRDKLTNAGFKDIEIEEVNRYTLADIYGDQSPKNDVNPVLTEALASRFTSAFVRAVKA